MAYEHFHDYKYWIQNRAEEIAVEEYGKEFYDLPDELWDKVYQQAIEAYKEAYADRIDSTYEAIRDKQEDMSELLTGEERTTIWEQYKREHPDPEVIPQSDFGYVNRLLKAQLAKARPIIEKQERERIIRWVEENSEYDIISKQSVRIIVETDWQALKDKP